MKEKKVFLIMMVVSIITVSSFGSIIGANSIDLDKKRLPDGVQVNFLGTKFVKVIEEQIPPEYHLPPYAIYMIIINGNNEKIDCDFEWRFSNNVLLRNKVCDDTYNYQFECAAGLGSAIGCGVVYEDFFEKSLFGFVTLKVTGEINGESFSKTGLFLIVPSKIITLIGGINIKPDGNTITEDFDFESIRLI